MNNALNNLRSWNNPDAETSPRELATARSTWWEAIAALRAESRQLLAHIEANPDAESADITARLARTSHDIALFEMCIDRANEYEEMLSAESRLSASHLEAQRMRDRYFHLMATLGRATVEHADGRKHLHLLGAESDAEESWETARWVDELSALASEARHALAAPAAKPLHPVESNVLIRPVHRM